MRRLQTIVHFSGDSHTQRADREGDTLVSIQTRESEEEKTILAEETTKRTVPSFTAHRFDRLGESCANLRADVSLLFAKANDEEKKIQTESIVHAAAVSMKTFLCSTDRQN